MPVTSLFIPGPRSKPFDILIVFQKEYFENVNFEKNQQRQQKLEKLPSMQRVKQFYVHAIIIFHIYLRQLQHAQIQKVLLEGVQL